MQNLLIVDDEPNIAAALQAALSGSTLTVHVAHTARDGIEFVRKSRPDVALFDIRLPDMSGLDAYDELRKIAPRLPVVFMTAYARMETAIEATRRGAFDYLVKPLDLSTLRATLTRALEVSRLVRSTALVSDDEAATDDDADVIVGRSGAMQEVFKTIGRVAREDAIVLILGESGVGKELIARAIYQYSRRNEMPFLAINCAALPETLLESELFGYEKGAFTGADRRHIGKFEQMHGGTIFLDEIGDMSPATQAKALRLLQQQQFERLGGNETIETDVRVIAATNRDIHAMVERGEFRRDLYYRLNGITIALPPLRERPEDIEPLVRHFIREQCRATDRREAGITAEAIEVLRAHDWPGNVRELRSAVNYALIHAVGDVITPDLLPEACRTSPKTAAPVAAPNLAPTKLPATTLQRSSSQRDATTTADETTDLVKLVETLLAQGETNIYRRVLARADQVVLDLVMRRVQGNQVHAAQLLGVSRMTLRNKLQAIATAELEEHP